jgi:hypothetical protein
MVLDLIPGKKIFVQRDVRETPAATATASAVGLTDKHYLVVDLDADLTEERALTAGEGIDFTDLGANSTLTINGENASDANKGIASFDVTDFTVTAGNVVLNAERISDLVGAMVTGNTETGMTVTYQDVDNTIDFVNDGVTSAVAGEGIDVSGATGAVTISCEDATSANKGIASFDATDFLVTAGAVTLANKTSYWSSVFIVPQDGAEDAHKYYYDIDSLNISGDFENGLICPVNLPNGAVVTGAVVYGNAGTADETWTLRRITISDGTAATMATAACNTEDTTISNATIDNSLYAYSISITAPVTSDVFYGARVKYTTDYV